MKKLILILILLLSISGCAEQPFTADTSRINVWSSQRQELPFDLHSDKYLLVDLSDFVFTYAKKDDEIMYPASLTKVMTMDTVLALVDDLSKTSYVTYAQVEALIEEDASIAYLKRDEPYTLEDLLYALILPSGADAALALENYFTAHGMDLVEQMNIRAQELGCSSSHFVNTTGLHDDDHYTTLDDLFLIFMDAISFAQGRQILESMDHTLSDGLQVTTGIRVTNVEPETPVLGGKTGYTPEAGQNIFILYRNRGKSYMMILGNAPGSAVRKEYYHYDDAVKIIQELY